MARIEAGAGFLCTGRAGLNGVESHQFLMRRLEVNIGHHNQRSYRHLEKRGYRTLARLVFIVASAIGVGGWIYSVNFLS